MSKVTFILGGARSGKSAYAIELAKRYRRVAFVATCNALDKEMRRRIEQHRKIRPKEWPTFELIQDMPKFLKEIGSKFEMIIIDCMTLMVSDLILKGLREDVIEEEIEKMVSVLKKIKSSSIIVSNEVGLGIVPKNRPARGFRDIAGRVNQIVTYNADSVFFMFSGLPLRLK